jgi:hypothetical protein
MLLYKQLLLVLFIFSALRGNTQQFKNNVGAPYTGLSAYSKKFTDLFGMTTNVAALGEIKNSGIGIFGERRFNLSELNNFSGNLVLATRSGSFGIQGNRFGFEGFNETQLGLGYGLPLGEKISLGGKINYYSQQVPGYGNAATVNYEAGLLLHLTARLHSGISVFNPAGGKFGINKTEKLVSIYKFGLGFDVSDKVFLAAETVKEENKPLNLIGAVHYQFEKKFFAKLGVSTAASNIFAAIGLRLNNQFRLDLFASHHQQLGISPGIQLHFNFSGKK